MIYFDYNATTPMLPEAKEAWLAAQEQTWGNASAGYQLAAHAKASLEQARTTLASFFNVSSEQIVFCSGATEACNIWIQSCLASKQQDQSLIVSELEHACVFDASQHWAKNRKDLCGFRPGKAGKEGVIQQLNRLLEAGVNPCGVMMMAVNNSTGEIFDWEAVQDWCSSKGIPYFCDATQWVGKYPTQKLGKLDFFCGSAHKFGGPKGVGFLKVSRKFHSIVGQFGGGQESGMRAGTENIPSIQAMTRALEKSLSVVASDGFIEERIRWKQAFWEFIDRHIPNLVLHVDFDDALWNTVSFAMPDKESAWWIQKLDSAGFAIASGGACSTHKVGIPRVMRVMKIEESFARRTLRVSGGWQTSAEDWIALGQAIVDAWNSRNEGKSSLTEVISIDDL